MVAEKAKAKDETKDKSEILAGYTGMERAAIMLFSLPEEQAQTIFKKLDIDKTESKYTNSKKLAINKG